MVDDIFGGRRAHQDPVPLDVTPPARDAAGDGPGDGSDRQPRTGRTRRIVIGAVVATGLLGAGLFGSATLRILQQKDATLVPTPEAAGLVRDNSTSARDTAEYLHSAFAAGIDLDRSSAVVYRDPADPDRSVLFFGGTTTLWSPERDLDTLIGLVGDEEGAVSGLRGVPAGRYGGVMKCGSTPADAEEMPVCGWADHGSIAVALFPGRTVDEAADLLQRLRDDIQQRD
ncbi:hypothetical protein O7623_11880 [Solwaraspora sp. WMMD791]|uniref:hypothetical protein n=1 Tax=Solwaraspora sp. WMMD791 TaxID=3016086 RepID=UPI00249AF944|nr:hypothetical protein [Solwaraspora sp. WMMD791]WFE29832.1 hypothetical protein O7623_11880 [Solwaraspora sp. WMMD791]